MIDLAAYRSPVQEESFYKNIPIQHLKEVQDHFRGKVNKIRYIFRGPRYDPMRVSTRKADATGFSIYVSNWVSRK